MLSTLILVLLSTINLAESSCYYDDLQSSDVVVLIHHYKFVFGMIFLAFVLLLTGIVYCSFCGLCSRSQQIDYRNVPSN